MRDFEKLMVAYFEGRLDKNLKSGLLKALEENEQLKKQFFQLKTIWDYSGKIFNTDTAGTDQAWKEIADELKPYFEQSFKKIRLSSLKNILKYAAVFLLGAGLSYGSINLAKIISGNKQVAENEIITHKGQKSQVVLSDGTKIWLNAETILKYPAKFGMAGSRNVSLEGEAYFEVAKDTKHPFIVNTGNLDIRVLGTTFNVKCYPEDMFVETTLIEGRVSIKKRGPKTLSSGLVTLKPNQTAVFNKSDFSIVVSNLNDGQNKGGGKRDNLKPVRLKDAKSVTYWKDHILYFDNESLAEIIIKLERWYGYSIQVKDPELLDHRYKGKFSNNETIYQVLDAIRLTTPIKYTVKDKNITIEKSRN